MISSGILTSLGHYWNCGLEISTIHSSHNTTNILPMVVASCSLMLVLLVCALTQISLKSVCTTATTAQMPCLLLTLCRVWTVCCWCILFDSYRYVINFCEVWSLMLASRWKNTIHVAILVISVHVCQRKLVHFLRVSVYVWYLWSM